MEKDTMEYQIGKETDWGDQVATTAKLMEIEDLELAPEEVSEAHAEVRGDLTPSYNATLDRKAGAASLSGIATYEDLPYWLDSLLGEATPTGTDPYEYAYAGPGAKPTPRMMTLTKGDATFAQCLTSALVNVLTLEFPTNGPVTLSVEFFGHGVEDDSIASLNDRAVNIIHGNDVTLYVDTWAGTIGATPYPGIAFTITFKLDANRGDKPGLGDVNPLGWKQQRGDPGANQLMMSLEFDTNSDALLSTMLTGTDIPFRRQVQINCALDASHSLEIDFAGFAAAAPTLHPDEDGVATLEFTLDAQENTTMGGWLDIRCTNTIATLP